MPLPSSGFTKRSQRAPRRTPNLSSTERTVQEHVELGQNPLLFSREEHLRTIADQPIRICKVRRDCANRCCIGLIGKRVKGFYQSGDHAEEVKGEVLQ